MNIKRILTLGTVLTTFSAAVGDYVTPPTMGPLRAAHRTIEPLHKTPTPKKRPKNQDTILMQYTDEPLVDIINQLAAIKGMNILMPMKADVMTTKVTLNIEVPLTIEQAWDMTLMLINMAGYSFIPKETMSSIVKNSKNIAKDSIPLFVGMDPDALPDNDERIRYLYYLSNIKLSDDPNSEIVTILKEFLPAETASWQFDLKTNGVILTDTANNIKSVMKIIKALDQTTYQEKLDILSLRYVDANLVARIFNDGILKAGNDPSGRYKLKGKRGEATYFSEQLRVVPDTRNNKLVLLGKDQAVNRAKEFIYKYIDVPMETGESILHVYQLQYLSAATFAPTLKNIVTAELAGGAGQSTAGGGESGLERYFKGVLISSDEPLGGQKAGVPGGNKLIIAAKNDDWKHIRKLIEQLDVPFRQVIIEILIADLTISDLRQLGVQLRNPQNLPFPPGPVNMQSAQLATIVLDSPNANTPANLNPPTTIASDLLSRSVKNSAGNLVSVAELTAPGTPGTPGSTLIEINDPTTGNSWGLLQILRQFTSTKILSHPHVIATNLKPARVRVGQQRLVAGAATATAAAPTIQQVPIEANTEIKITPKISGGNIVNLQVLVTVQEFVSGTVNTINTRMTETNANVINGDVLVLGGLMSLNTTDGLNRTPLLGQIPLLGWLFKNRSNSSSKTSLTVFISPTIIEPRLRGGVSEYTKDYIELAKEYSQEAQLFDGLRDPITRFYFRGADDAAQSIDTFIAKDELKKDLIIELDKAEPTNVAKKEVIPRIENKPRSPANTITNTGNPQGSIAALDQKQRRDSELKQLFADLENPMTKSPTLNA
jgi:general secretion pathway protein D